MTTWPITAVELRKALLLEPGKGDSDELDLYARAACERIDEKTGRSVTPTRHELAPGVLPLIFTLAARETAKLWWQQSKNGPRMPQQQPGDQIVGPPMGADLPRKVEAWLSPYPPPPGIA